MDSSYNPRTLWILPGDWWRVKIQGRKDDETEGNTKPWMLNKSWTIWGMDGFSFFGVPNVLRLDPAGAFRSREMERMCDEYDIYLDLIPGEAHWQLGSCEQAVQGAKEVMTKLAEQDPERDPARICCLLLWRLSMKEKWSEDFLLVNMFLGRAFDETGRFIHPETTNGIDLMVPNPGEECIEGIQLRKRAEQALSEWQASQRVNRGMQSRAKPKYNYHAGDLVYFWRKQVSGQKPGKNGMFFGTCEGFSHGNKKWTPKGIWPPVALSGWLEGDRRLS